MKDFLKETGISKLNPGDKLNADIINTFNDRINKLVKVVNRYLNNYCDINSELGDFTTKYTLDQALQESPRRSLGIKLRFLGTNNKYEEHSYTGLSCDDIDWMNHSNWVCGDASIIDGGEWSI